jgi:hypothetical protein
MSQWGQNAAGPEATVFERFRSCYKAEFRILDGEDAWREWIERHNVQWGWLKLAVEKAAESCHQRHDKPSLREIKRLYVLIMTESSRAPLDIKPDFLCRSCGNTGKMILLWHQPSRSWVRPGCFEPLKGVEIFEHCCWCSHGVRQASFTSTPHDTERCKAMKAFAVPPAFPVFERAGRNIVDMGGEIPPEAQTRAEFASLRDDGWTFWARETAMAQIAACAKKAGLVRP